jgi:hypothetical protein
LIPALVKAIRPTVNVCLRFTVVRLNKDTTHLRIVERQIYMLLIVFLIIIIIIITVITHNLAKTITDKQNKHQELANEICAVWKQKAAQVIPIVISSRGVIPKSLSQSLTRLNLHPNAHIQLQKSVILGTCSIIRNFLNYK